MKKWLIGLTMGTMVFSLGQATSAEASFSSNTPTCNTQVKYDISANMKEVNLDSATQKQLMEQIYAQLSANGFKQSIDFKAPQKAATPAKQEVAKPVAQKPAAEAQPVAKAPEAKPVAQPVAKPAAPKPAPTAPPVAEEKPASTPAASPNASISSIEQQVLTLTNQERAKAGLKPLATDAKLMNAAREKSTDMRTNKYFSHTSPTLGSPFDRMKELGITYKAAAENIAMGQQSASEVVKAWMESPGHRANIMNGNFTHIGIGYDAQGHYWTQQFIQK
jgi:uncharacterized YkwD family protein